MDALRFLVPGVCKIFRYDDAYFPFPSFTVILYPKSEAFVQAILLYNSMKIFIMVSYFSKDVSSQNGESNKHIFADFSFSKWKL